MLNAHAFGLNPLGIDGKKIFMYNFLLIIFLQSIWNKGPQVKLL